MITRQQLDRLALRITGNDIRLVGYWERLPGLDEHLAEFAAELGVTEIALGRCHDIVEVLDLTGNCRNVRPAENASPWLLP